MNISILSCLLLLSSCTMFEKNSGSNELESLTRDVLKKGEGVEIDVKPIMIPKK